MRSDFLKGSFVKKLIYILSFSTLLTSSAFADVLSCELRNGSRYAVEYADAKDRQASVQLDGYSCDATVKNGVIEAILYRPILHTDQDFSRGRGQPGRAVTLQYDSATCMCSLM
jgi:hypothetical protein